ncbi:transcription antitermination factor NusB [Acidithiobacillus sp.]|uniref:transcription antitermination factor NusB n=1 Tax=Acidithiobacillus sp. TaxID=1872118 RepID=UPI0026064184|nr:transcription antitermination factor NusB [Acidithiobacillus sp.]MDD2750050.1 transcription antitermination factor NusB [Acidithiobacillus sp.]MDD5278525.1 transcription antitermination factor NusB [Acidithiobacillus sp.]
MKNSRRRLARQAIIQALYQWQLNPGHCAEIALQFTADPERLQGADRVFFATVWEGVCQAIPQLDPTIAEEIPDRRWTDEISEVERAILRLAAYELRDLPQTPYRVVINEAIELGKAFGAEQGHRFVNAVLDKLAQRWRQSEIEQSTKS